jgi:hypothetical protein
VSKKSERRKKAVAFARRSHRRAATVGLPIAVYVTAKNARYARRYGAGFVDGLQWAMKSKGAGTIV